MNEVERPLTDEKWAWREVIFLVRYALSTQTERSSKQSTPSTTPASSRRTCVQTDRAARKFRLKELFFGGRPPGGRYAFIAARLSDERLSFGVLGAR
jgi:hypothetical protein